MARWEADVDNTDRTDDARPTNGLGRYTDRFSLPGAAIGLDRTWVLIALVVPALVAFVSKTSTIDLAYHVRTGLQILGTHRIPRVDAYSFAASGTPWFDQQWLSQVLFASAWKAGGWATIIAVRGVMVSLGMGTLYLTCRWLGARARTSVFLCVGGFLLALPNLSARPQIFAVPLFTITLWLLASRRAHPRRLWFVPFVVAVWSNVHGSFPLSLLLVGLALAADLLDRDFRSAGRTTLTLVGAALATAHTPFGPTVWTYVWDLLRNPQIRNGVSEWEPPRLDSVWGVAFWASAVGVLVLAWIRRSHLRIADLLVLLAFGFMAAEAGRNELWWGLVLPVVVAGWFPARLDTPPRRSSGKLEGTPIKLVLAAAAIALLPWWRGSSPGAFLIDAPPGVVTAVRDQPAGSRVFAPQPWGSWFEREAPDQLVFLDSRIELYPPPLWQDYVTMYNAKPGWEAVMTRWRVSVVALPNDAPLEKVIGHSLGWTQIYAGSDGAVFVAAGAA
jgi:hypothetical protein